MWDSVDSAVRSVDARPDPRGGGRVAGAHVRGSVAWSCREREASRRVRAPARGPHRGVDRRRRSEAAPGAGRVCAGWGRRGRAACVPAATRRGGGHGGRARVSGPWVVPGPGTEWRTRVPPRAPGMLLGEEPPPLPPLPRCNALLPVYGTCAAARPGRIVDAGIYEALGKTGALEGRHR